MDFGTGTGTGGSETRVSSAAPRRKGFFRSLVDISFTSFVTGRVVKFIYVLSVVFVVLYVILTTVYLAFIAYSFVSAFAESEALGIIVAVVLFIILTPLFLLIGITYVRVLLELVIVLFRISDDVAEIARQGRVNSARPSPQETAPRPDPPVDSS
ncbi:MAG: hypothetical protein QOI57_2473 [Rubrobacteraceae bacterium]|nr:hypothetical protein [Rubrobacteraceae bacterium]